MLLPTTLPMAMSVLPSSTAPTLTATSGALVPKATMVSPTTSGLMPNDIASLDAPRTSKLAPMTRRIRPPRNMSKFMIGSVAAGVFASQASAQHEAKTGTGSGFSAAFASRQGGPVGSSRGCL